MLIPLVIIILLFGTYIVEPQFGQVDQLVECGTNNPFFVINFLTPYTDPIRLSWASRLREEFPKICIGIYYNLEVGWQDISQRTWAFDIDSTIDGLHPTFVNGGFDLLFVGFSNIDPPNVRVDRYYYSNTSIESGGFNLGHFANFTFDSLHDEYIQEPDPVLRDNIAAEIQEVLYQQQPSLSLYYPQNLWAYNSSLMLSDADIFGLSTASISRDWVKFSISGADDIVYAHPYNSYEFSPHQANSLISRLHQSAVWQGLYARDLQTREWEPLIAASLPTYDDDNTKVTVDIRNDVTFADGHLLDSQDVIESFKQILDPSWGHLERETYTNHFEDFFLGEGGVIANDVIKAIDNNTIEFNLSEPYFDTLGLLSFAILPTHIWGTDLEPVLSNYNYSEAIANTVDGINTFGWGTGPYMYENSDEEVGIIHLVKNSNYWDGEVNTHGITFQRFNSKDEVLANLTEDKIHIIDPNFDLIPTEVNEITGFEYIGLTNFAWQEIAFNMHHPILGTGISTPLGQSDPARAAEAAMYVRQALSHAIPRQDLIDEFSGGLGSPGITAGWMPGTLGYSGQLTPYEYSEAKAKELLAKAGYDQEFLNTRILTLPVINSISTTAVTSSQQDTSSDILSDSTIDVGTITNNNDQESDVEEFSAAVELGVSFTNLLIIMTLPIIIIQGLKRYDMLRYDLD